MENNDSSSQKPSSGASPTAQTPQNASTARPAPRVATPRPTPTAATPRPATGTTRPTPMSAQPTATRPTVNTVTPRPAAGTETRPAAGAATRPVTNTQPTPSAQPAGTRPTPSAQPTATRPAVNTQPAASRPVHPTMQAVINRSTHADAQPPANRPVQVPAQSGAVAKEVPAKSETPKTITKSNSPKQAQKSKSDADLKKVTLVTIASTLAACFLVILICTLITLPPKITLTKLLARSAQPVNPTAVTTYVGAAYEDKGTTARNKPVQEIKDGGLKAANGDSAYPTYGKTKSLTEDERKAVIAENDQLCARPTQNANGVYDKMDKDGYLYNLDGTKVLDASGNHRRLYQHTGSVGLYGGDVSPSEPGVIKSMTFKKRSYNSYYNVTGLYAPAGEVIKIEMREEDMTATGGIVIHIGQALYNGQSNNIWAARDLNRMPVLLNTMNMTVETSTYDNGVYTCYVGSFLGGPIYIRDENPTFSVTISGAVNYPHFILGSTTKEKFEQYRKSSAPIFDLEVWESGVLHSGPKTQVAAFSYEDLTKAAVLWEKVALVSTKVTNQGIVFLYDPFVAAGAAVAFPGRRSVNCPVGWMENSLNYQSIVTAGTWGNFHEYHHNFQGGWGFGYTGEVTNNALNLVSYSLFTKISANRSIGSFGAAGLSGWNTYTSAPWALNRVNNGNITDTNGLAVYATLLHNFGQDAFIKSKASGTDYLNKWAQVTHQDFSYYAGIVQTYSGVSPSSLTPTEYPAFVPVSCVYQTGRSYTYDGEKKYFQTMQPYVVPTDEPFRVDLNPYTANSAGQYQSGSIVIGRGLSYKIKNVDASNASGTFTKTDEEGVYTYTPDANADFSGKIVVTLEISDEENALLGKRVDDVDLVLEFQHSDEARRFTLQRTVYSYAAGNQPTDAVEAFTHNYAGNIGKKESDNYNVAPNSNTDVWLEEPGTSLPAGAPDTTIREENSVIEVRGKLKFAEAGKYRVVLRGRWEAALFLSTDGGKTYFNAAHLTKVLDNNRYRDFTFDEEGKLYYDLNTSDIQGPDGFLYFKSVLVTARNNNLGIASYMGLGFIRWEPPMYTTKTDENGNTIYYDESGEKVPESEVANATPREPTQANKVSYATAYRNSYEWPKEFTSDYFYKSTYNYDYHDDDAKYLGDTQTLVDCTKKNGWGGMASYAIDSMFDGNPKTSFISQFNPLNPDNPFTIVAKLDAPVTANYVNIVGQHERAWDDSLWHMPLEFTLDGSTDGENWYSLVECNEAALRSFNEVYAFDGYKTFEYYKLVVYRTTGNRLGLNCIRFMDMSYSLTLTGNGDNHKSPDDAMFTYKGDWRWVGTESNFGHVNVGGKNATMDFTFEGTRFMLLTSKSYGNKFEVYIDGKKVSSIAVKEDPASYGVRFISPKLSAGKHTVAIRALGQMNIDSVVLYNEA